MTPSHTEHVDFAALIVYFIQKKPRKSPKKDRLPSDFTRTNPRAPGASTRLGQTNHPSVLTSPPQKPNAASRFVGRISYDFLNFQFFQWTSKTSTRSRGSCAHRISPNCGSWTPFGREVTCHWPCITEPQTTHLEKLNLKTKNFTDSSFVFQAGAAKVVGPHWLCLLRYLRLYEAVPVLAGLIFFQNFMAEKLWLLVQ